MKRRSFLIAGGSAVLAGASSLSLDKLEPDFDHTFDMIVIGSGTGLCAALAGAKAGLEVLVLEKHALIGGTTLVSGGVLWVPNNRVMRREGLSDSRADALEYLEKLSLGQSTPDIMEAFVNQGPRMLEFIESATSIRWRVSKRMREQPDYHPEWPGARLRGRSLEPIHEGEGRSGGLLIAELTRACRASGVEIWNASPARRLITAQENGRTIVKGVEADVKGERKRIRARRGVAIISGGFERNEEMKKHFLRGPSPYTLGAETNEGDGIQMAMAVGADLRNMNEVWHEVVYKELGERSGHVRGGATVWAQIEGSQPGSIRVNRYGERFSNESASYDVTWRCFHTWENWGDTGYRNLPSYAIFDHVVRETGTIASKSSDEPLPDWVVVAQTLGELAEQSGIDPQGLSKTVARFNQFAAGGTDPDFHRGEGLFDTRGSGDPLTTLRPLQNPPFYSAEVSPADLGTCGGIRVNDKAEVLDVFGERIVGLYAAGNTSGVGSPGALYGGGGGTLGPAFTFAFIAGEQVAKS